MPDLLATYLHPFRLQWGIRFLSVNDVRCEPAAESLISLNSSLLSGWYMLEMKIRTTVARLKVQVVLKGGSPDAPLSCCGFPLQSGRMCKRLIHLEQRGQMSIRLPAATGDFEIQHFRLVRVTRRFAVSRMLKRLQAQHPRYNKWLGLQRFGQDAAVTAGTTDLPTLRDDYYALFEENTEILSYAQWIREFDTASCAELAEMQSRIQRAHVTPLISIIMPVYNPDLRWLEQAIDSVLKQLYPHWELCIADDASTDDSVRTLLVSYSRRDPRIKVVYRDVNGHISAASNSALSLAQGEWLALMDQDDLIPEHALLRVVGAMIDHPDCRLMYSDEDKVDEQGERSDPYFKCDWNQDLFYSHNMFSHLGVYHAELVEKTGGFRPGLEGAQDYDLALRCIEQVRPEQIHHIPRILYHWRMHPGSSAHAGDVKPYAVAAGERALNEHFIRKRVDATAEATDIGYRVRYALPAPLPLVSLVIPTRNNLKLLKKCVESILRRTTYPNFEILIVDNGSDDPTVEKYLRSLTSKPPVRVIRDDRPFNFSALNNSAVTGARGDIVGLVNDDLEVITPEWLSEMVSHVLRPEVGVVGARLWYPDETLQHAGVVLGGDTVASHLHRYLPRGQYGYFQRAAVIQSFSAVTGACLLVRTSVYKAVGGMNETELPVTCNDIDFCLKVRTAGYRIIWTPHAELYHHESATRGFDDTPEKLARAAGEIAYMHRQWDDIIRNDPAYNRNLTTFSWILTRQ